MTRAEMLATLLRESLRRYPDLGAAAHAARAVVATGARLAPWPAHLVRHGGRRYGFVARPGFPSPAYTRLLAVELNKHARYREGFDLTSALLAVTRRCPLRCAHCSEWDSLNHEDPLSVEDLCAIARALQARGVVHLELTGGEPLARIDAVEAIARALGTDTDCWVLTSGAPMTDRVARRLVDAGVVGVMVSLDHWDPARHDAFRGVPGTFERAVRAMSLARDAGLLMGASVTATRETANPDDLLRVVDVARAHGARFVRVLEPHAAGRWSSADVALREEHRAAIASLQRAVDRAWPDDAPILEAPDAIRVTDRCQGAGRRYLFVDAAGDVHACPFCHGAAGNVLRDGLDACLARLRASACASEALVPQAALRARATGDHPEVRA